MWVKIPSKITEPKDNPFLGKSNPRREEKTEEEKTPLIVDTTFSLQCPENMNNLQYMQVYLSVHVLLNLCANKSFTRRFNTRISDFRRFDLQCWVLQIVDKYVNFSSLLFVAKSVLQKLQIIIFVNPILGRKNWLIP